MDIRAGGRSPWISGLEVNRGTSGTSKGVRERMHDAQVRGLRRQCSLQTSGGPGPGIELSRVAEPVGRAGSL